VQNAYNTDVTNIYLSVCEVESEYKPSKVSF